jgi:hypothetical protein
MGENFFTSSDLYTDGLGDQVGARWARVGPATLFVTKDKRVESFNGTPMNVTEGGTSVDLKYDRIVADSARNTTISFNIQRGFTLSGYEGSVLELFYQSITGISTTSILNKAIETNISVFFIANDTLERLENLSIPQEDKEIIEALLNGSSDVFAIVPNNTIQIGNWTGTGYAIIDGRSGAGKYLISGGLNGGSPDRPTPKKPNRDLECAALAVGIGVAIPLVLVNAACLTVFFTPVGLAAGVFCTTLFLNEFEAMRQTWIIRPALPGMIIESWNNCT